MAYDFEAIHELIDKALSEEDFALMCQYQFEEVHGQFSTGMGKPLRIGRLMDHVRRREEEIPKLLDYVKKKNRDAYSRYEKQRGTGSGTLPAAETIKSDSVPSGTSTEEGRKENLTDSTPSSVEKAYALVIGITDYEGVEPGQHLPDDKFTNLTYAAKDAEAFFKYLKQCSHIKYDVRPPLVDEQATLSNIKDEFDDLSRRCKKTKNSLVIVYFSGHGMTDKSGRHYLIPYGAKRDKLFATALWNKDFNNYLGILKTEKLVVFLDACHSGDFGVAGEMDGVSQQYNPHDISKGRGRYIIASCSQGQRSYEWKSNESGVFTGHLLKLLKFESQDFTDEQIDLSSLYEVLREKVDKTAKDECKKTQEPFSPEIQIDESTGRFKPTGIILAINQQVKKKKLQSSALEALENHFKKGSNYKDKLPKAIISKLRAHVEENENLQGHQEFYEIFDERQYPGLLDSQAQVENCCDLLVRTHMQAEKSAQGPQGSESPAQTIAFDNDRYEARRIDLDSTISRKQSPGTGLQTPSKQACPGLGQEQETKQERRDLSVWRGEILKPLTETIAECPSYFEDAGTLLNILGQPVGEGEFKSALVYIRCKKKDERLEAILEKVLKCFEQRFSTGTKAAIIEPQTVSSLMIQKGKDEYAR